VVVPYAALVGQIEPGPGIAAVDPRSTQNLLEMLGGCRLLQECHLPFDVLDEEGDFSRYRTLVLCRSDQLGPDLVAGLRDFVAAGGRLLAAGPASTRLDDGADLAELLGVDIEGDGDGRCYLALGSQLRAGLPDMPRCVEGTWQRVRLRPGGECLAQIIRPRLADTGQPIGWGYPPEREASEWPGIVRSRFGAGEVVYAAAPLFADYANVPDEEQRLFLQNLVDAAAPLSERPALPFGLPPAAEVSLMEHEGRWVYHILRGGATEPPVLHGVTVDFLPPFAPSRAYTAPDERSLELDGDNGVIHVCLPAVGSHTIVVLEP